MGRNSSDDQDYKVKEKPQKRKRNRINSLDGLDEEKFYKDEDDLEYLKGLNDVDYLKEIDKRKDRREILEKERKLKEQLQKKKLQQLDQKKKNQSRRYSSSSSGSQSYSSDNDRDNSEDSESDLSQQKNRTKNKQELQQKQQTDLFEAIKKITLTRDQLENLVKQSNFADQVKGMFVRARSDQGSNMVTYVFSQIINVEEGPKLYQLSNNSQTKYLLHLFDSGQKKKFQIRYVSNSYPGEGELTTWFENQKQQSFKFDLQVKTQDDVGKVLKEFNTKQKENKNVSSDLVAKQLRKIEDNLKKGVEMKRDELNFAKDKLKDKIQELTAKIEENQQKIDEESFKDQAEKKKFLDEIKIKSEKVEKYNKLLIQIEEKRQVVKTTIINQKHSFFVVPGAHLKQTEQKQQKEKLKKELMIKKMQKLNMQYVQELQMNRQFATYQGSQQIKKDFQELHSRNLDKIDQEIDKWEEIDLKTIIPSDTIQ